MIPPMDTADVVGCAAAPPAESVSVLESSDESVPVSVACESEYMVDVAKSVASHALDGSDEDS